MYQLTYKGKTKKFNNIEALSNELLWIWVEDLGLDYDFNPDGTVTFDRNLQRDVLQEPS